MTPLIAAVHAAVDRNQLADAATQLNIVVPLGGALGGALLAVVVARELPQGAERAFHVAFW
ncbi:hypothetical protein HRbin41_01249 [bacterium HR41]|nr:hypothetical protein HRbin41_01249 [bacterium HR41]